MRTLLAYFFNLQALRDASLAKKYEADIRKAGEFLVEAYLANVWPEMKVLWGTYLGHLGHQHADEGFGCFRCHDEEHITENGASISQECNLCHDEPE